MSSPSERRSAWEEDAPDTVRKPSGTVRTGGSRPSDEMPRRSTRHRTTSAPPSITAHHGRMRASSRAPEAASSTLRQNKAFVERLRRAAIRSDRPPPIVRTAMLTEDAPPSDEAPFALARRSHHSIPAAISIVPASESRAKREVEVTAQLPPARRAAERDAERVNREVSQRMIAARMAKLRKRATMVAIVLAAFGAAVAVAYFDPGTESAKGAPVGVVTR